MEGVRVPEPEGDCVREEGDKLSFAYTREDGVKGVAELADEEEGEGDAKERGGGVVDGVRDGE